MLKHEQMSRVDKCQQKFLDLDLYQQPFMFLLPDERDKYRTFLGSLLSLATFITITVFAAYKLADHYADKDYNILVHEKKFFYDEDEEFSFNSNKFMFGAAVTAFDGKGEDITDPEIGEVKFYRKQWGDDIPGLLFEEMETVPCMKTDYFGASGKGDLHDAVFLPFRSKEQRQFEAYNPKLLCPKNLNDVVLKGNYDTDAAINLMIVFEKCDPIQREKKGLKCKSEEQITEWMEFKYIIVL